jgi:DNA modification methylase
MPAGRTVRIDPGHSVARPPRISPDPFPEVSLTPAYSTRFGRAYHTDALTLLGELPDDSIDLVVTSPPFALLRQKCYGNVTQAEYADWFVPFADQIFRVLKPTGSFVLELGGSWNRGKPTRSLYQYELILRLARTFHLAQDFYWHNPSRLPTPAEWVTIQRTRVKDGTSLVWWLSKTENPEADNRRVLVPYSPSMKRLLANGYTPATRPSQHVISEVFQRDNGGAIPSNLLNVPNTKSNELYLRRCKEEGVKPHPARFPIELPDFFVRFLTSPGAIVLDPFAGSNTTGAAAERLDRRWLCSEPNEEYLQGSRFRFNDVTQTVRRRAKAG